MSSFDDTFAFIPQPWVISHLIRIGEGDWQVILVNETHLVSATGASPAEAVLQAANRTCDPTRWAKLWTGEHYDEDTQRPLALPTLVALGLIKPRPPIRRRSIR